MPVNKAPYKIQKRGDKFVVVNNGGEVKGTHPNKKAALDQLRALYASVPGAGKAADRKPWTGKQKRAVKAAADDESTETDPSYDPGVLAAAVDALLDTLVEMFEDLDEASLTPDLKQIRDLLYAGDPLTDRLLKLLGVQDPDAPEDEMFDQRPQAEAAAKTPAKPHGDVSYADPGYQKDKVKRYPIDSADHVRSAWSYINQPGNAAKYTPQQRESIKTRIRSAGKKFGVDIAAEKAAQLDRLTKQYGPVDAVSNKPPAGLPPMPPLGPSGNGLPPREVENRSIKENAKSAAAQGPHPFMQAQFPADNGAARCLLCGSENDAHKVFEPEIPVAAAEGSAVRAPLTVDLSVLHPTHLWNGPVNTGYTLSTGANGTWTTQPRTPVLKEAEHLPPPESTKAFLTEVNGHTLLTAPANVFTTETEKALHANENFLWMQGRFVGAERANRNGAFWKTEDLELGELTVRHGPLNWLHEARHVIGTIADTKMVTRDEQTASDLEQPHISALSAIWKWIYPDEAWVVEQASDSGKLWYSMECISKEVACVGDNGCGATASYGDYLKGQGGTCAHMTERSATRHFANPTFLGGAVIVPPVRPGWAEADATVLRQASSMAEVSYEQACPANTTASEWEQLMAQLVRYAGR